MNVAWCDYYVIFKVENVDNRLTAALLSAGLSNFVRSDTSSSSRTESPDIIPGKDSPKSFASSDDLDSSISVKTNAVWETTEQRMNTKAPVSRTNFSVYGYFKRHTFQGLPEECKARVNGKNVGLIPKYLKPFNLSRGENGIPIYTCDYCQGQFRGHNSIVYHTRRHIGDYPYRCGTCGYAEVSKVRQLYRFR